MPQLLTALFFFGFFGFIGYQIHLDTTDPDRIEYNENRVIQSDANYMSSVKYFKDADQNVCFAMWPNRDTIMYVPCENLEAPNEFKSE